MYVNNINAEIHTKFVQYRRIFLDIIIQSILELSKWGVNLAAKKASFTDHQFSHTRIAVGCWVVYAV